MLTVIKKHKNGAPCAPFRLIILIVSQMRGALVTIKGAPQVPHGAPQENSTKACAYMQTVIWAYANGRLGARKRLFGHTQTLITLWQTPCNSVPHSTLEALNSSKDYLGKGGFWSVYLQNSVFMLTFAIRTKKEIMNILTNSKEHDEGNERDKTQGAYRNPAFLR